MNFEGNTVKYILETSKNNNDLIVVFSGIPRQGLKARYNYMRTLEKIDANKLFILDDLGYDQRGGFYLGKDNDYFMVRAVLHLVEKTKSDLSIDRTFYVGRDRKSTRLNSSHVAISYAVFCLKKKTSWFSDW